MAQNDQKIQQGKYNRFRLKYFPLLWFLAAAEEDILLLCPAVEQDKQAGIGLAILCTSIAACISCYYAIQSLFGTWYTALPLSLFWGMIILNLDRFMVVSMRKPRQKKPLKEVMVIIPRILLALFIALLISKPLEVRIFLHQIEGAEISFKEGQENKALASRSSHVEAAKKELSAFDAALDSARAVSNNPDLDPVYHQTRLLFQSALGAAARADERLAQLRARLAALALDDTRIEGLTAEIGGARARSREAHGNCNDLEKRVRLRAIAYSQEQAVIVRGMESRDSAISKNVQAKEALLARKADTVGIKMSIASQDILGQLRILDNLKKDDSSIAGADLLITSLFFLLELAPLLIKMGSSRGKYDTLICIAEQQALDEEGAAMEESKTGRIIREDAAARSNGEAAELDLALKKQVNGEILNAQAALARNIVAAWEQQENDELDRDPAGYLKGKITTGN